jgi:hypothetical protein
VYELQPLDPDDEEPTFMVVGEAAGGGDGPPPSDDPRAKALALLLTLRATLQGQALEWCRDRSWEVRVPIVLYLAWILVNHWGNIEYQSLLGGLNLGIHEWGHVLFRPLGEFMTIAGGTILQCLAPLLTMIMFYKQRDFFAIAFCFGWLSTNFFGCATYANDARGQLNLILVSPWGQGFGADGIGDWSRMLRKLGMLEWDTTIAFGFRTAANLSMLTFFVLGGWLMWQMYKSRR